MNVTLLTKPFDVHRCTADAPEAAAHWFDSVPAAERFYPLIKPFVPSQTPDASKVFHCPRCRFIAIVPRDRAR